MDFATLAAAQNYVDKTAQSLGAVKGAPCTIKSITEGENGSTIVFSWTGADGTEQTRSTFLPRGPQGEPGAKGDPGEPGKDGKDGAPGKDGSGIDTEARKQIAELSEEMVNKLGFDPTKQGLPIWYMWGDTTGEDKDNEVTLTYQFGEHSGTLKRKWQGSGSVDLGEALGVHIYGDANKGKFNYTIKLDKAFEAKEGWGTQKKYCLKANVADFSHARNLCALKLYGQACANRTYPPIDLYKCPNWGGVDGFPVLLVVNDEYFGLYTMTIPKDGWMLNMPTEGATHEAIVCAEVNANFSGPVTLGNAATYEIEYVTDENDTSWVKESLDALVTAIASQNYNEISARMDIDSAIDYLLLVARCTGGDAVSRNYLLYTRDGTKWAFVPYDADTWFGISWGGDGHPTDDYVPTIIDCAWTSKLMQYLVERVPEKITARDKELRGNILSASNIVNTIVNYSAQIPKAVFDAEVARWPGIGTTETNNVQQMVDHVRAREKVIDAEIARLDAPRLKSGVTWYNTEAAGAEMSTITDINFDPDYVVAGNEEASWDCSAEVNKSIMAYRTGTVVTIKPTNHKYVRLNLNSSYMFANDGTTASFSELTRITGTEILYANVGTSALHMCSNANKLITPVCIPEGVTTGNYAFYNCWKLRTPPVLPNGLRYTTAMFGAAGLWTMPQLPSSIIEMNFMFNGCASAANLPRVIPSSVITMNSSFRSCRKATGLMKIEAKNLTGYADVFLSAGVESNGIVLTGSSPALAELAATNADGKVTVLE